jgi:hypothetical protein
LLGMIGWLAGNVPRLAEIRQALVDVLAAAGKRAPTKSKRALASVPLTGRALGPRARRCVRAFVARRPLGLLWLAVETYTPSTDDTLIVMSDASRLGSAGQAS